MIIPVYEIPGNLITFVEINVLTQIKNHHLLLVNFILCRGGSSPNSTDTGVLKY